MDNYQELLSLRAELDEVDNYQELLSLRAALDAKIEEVRRSGMADAIVQAKQLIAFFGLSAAELGFTAPVKRAKRAPKAFPAKYFGPNGETWSGRGRAPKWMTGDRDLFLIPPVTSTTT